MAIEASTGIELIGSDQEGVLEAIVRDPGARANLSWDRFMRLSAAGEQIDALLADSDGDILDVGGFDGALALFAPHRQVFVIDPVTTGGCGTSVPADIAHYDLVASIDVLEHVEPGSRDSFVRELIRVAGRFIVINYPASHTREAQKLVLELTGNPFVKEHVDWELPESGNVIGILSDAGFSARVIQHTSLALWVSSYCLQAVSGEHSTKVDRYLIDNHEGEPYSVPLYEMIVASRA